ncbi:hypothetical protein ACFO9Q_07735 [Paenibacillus sp. GCM10023252]|uniref:hypothetical protein n=1 Tax=Paenibacillus sp. GCM10023252 TaxID=3252649 RepID=UPI003612046A
MNIQQIYEALQYGTEQKGDHQALFAEARDLRRWELIRTEPFWKEMLQETERLAEEHLKKSISVIPYSAFRIISETGSRKEYAQHYNEHRSRLNSLAILTMVHQDDRYLSELQDIIWAICDEYTWAMPAHLGVNDIILDDANHLTTEGRVQETKRPHRRSVELTNVMTGFALAEIVDLLEDRLSPLVVYRARKEVTERIIEPFYELNSFFGWEVQEHNWAAVCGGGAGAAALYLIKDNKILAPFLLRVISGLESFLLSYQEDGFCPEGLAYWEYGFGHYVYFAELLKERTAGKLDLLSDPKIRQIALYPQRVYLSEGNVVAYSDGHHSHPYVPVLTHRLKSVFPEMQIPMSTSGSRVGNKNYHYWVQVVRNFVWSDSRYALEEPAEESHYFCNAQFLIRRRTTAGKAVCFAAIGGHNGQHHNHNDVGHFVIHYRGETLLTDLGAGEYTAQYFGPDRYSLVGNGSQGHSVPIVEGQYQQAGEQFRAAILDVEQSEAQDWFRMELAGAYDVPNLRSLIREFHWDHSNEQPIRLKDSYTFERPPGFVTERFITTHQPLIGEDGTVRIEGEQGMVTIGYNPQAMECTIGQQVFMNNHLTAIPVFMIDFKLRSAYLTTSMQAEFTFHVGEIE